MTRRRRPRHAAAIGSGRVRTIAAGNSQSAVSPSPDGFVRRRDWSKPQQTVRTETFGPARPVDFSNPAPLTGLRNHLAQDGQTVVMRTVTLEAVPSAPGCTDATVTLAAAAAVVKPDTWYGPGCDNVEWRDAPDEPPPSLVASRLSDSGERALTELEAHLASSLGNSALRHRTPVDADWFRQGGYESSLRSFWGKADDPESRAAEMDRRKAALNASYKVTPVRSRGAGLPLDTGILPAVTWPEFDRSGVAR